MLLPEALRGRLGEAFREAAFGGILVNRKYFRGLEFARGRRSRRHSALPVARQRDDYVMTNRKSHIGNLFLRLGIFVELKISFRLAYCSSAGVGHGVGVGPIPRYGLSQVGIYVSQVGRFGGVKSQLHVR